VATFPIIIVSVSLSLSSSPILHVISSRQTPANMSNPYYSKSYGGGASEVEASEAPRKFSQAELALNLDEKARVSDYKAAAVEAENAEHNMGVLEAVRAYPMASFWAFVMSFTIVSCLSPFPLNLSSDEESQLTPS
jgi:hypothetical protein